MYFHRLIEDRISILPCDVFAKILSQFDIAKVREMKVVSKTFRRLISSEAFSADYNYSRRAEDDDVWALSHNLMPCDSIGWLLCIRQRDSKQVEISLDPFFRAIVGKNDILRLICASGSYLLFSVLDDYALVSLFVLDVFSSRLQQLPLPSSHRLNFRVLRHAKIILHPNNFAHHFKIRYAQLMGDDIPHYYEYDTLTQVWDIAGPAKMNETLNTDHPKSFIMGYPDFLYKVSFNLEQGLVYQRQDATHFVNRALDLVYLGPTYQNGLKRVTCHYGRISERWACIMVRCLDLYAHRSEFPGKAFLFRFSDSWDKYELISEVPHHLIPLSFNFANASCLHETHNSLNISLIVNDIVCVGRQLMLLKFDKTSNTWTRIMTKLNGEDKSFHPVYTDGFTLVPT